MYKKAFRKCEPRQHIQYHEYHGPQSKFVDTVDTVDVISDTVDVISDTVDVMSDTVDDTDMSINTSDPAVWGPSFWFTLHNGASKYPISASKIQIERMKGFILGIPLMLPCISCKVHASNYIEEVKSKLDYICGSRDNLFKWLVDFHNAVNRRQNKQLISYEDAYKIY